MLRMNARSKLSPQAQVSVPAEVRRKLGLAPGSVLSWEEQDDGTVVVRRVGLNSSKQIHERLFTEVPSRHSPAALKRGIRARMKRKHARD